MKLGRILVFSCLLFLNAASLFAAVTVRVRPARAPLTLTQPQQFTATVANTSNHNVTWAVDGVVGGNSTVGTISSAGLYHPPSSPGTPPSTARSGAQCSALESVNVWGT